MVSGEGYVTYSTDCAECCDSKCDECDTYVVGGTIHMSTPAIRIAHILFADGNQIEIEVTSEYYDSMSGLQVFCKDGQVVGKVNIKLVSAVLFD